MKNTNNKLPDNRYETLTVTQDRKY